MSLASSNANYSDELDKLPPDENDSECFGAAFLIEKHVRRSVRLSSCIGIARSPPGC